VQLIAEILSLTKDEETVCFLKFESLWILINLCYGD